MPDPARSEATIETVESVTIVSLKLGKAAVDAAVERLSLASPLYIKGCEPQNIWIGPDHWLLVSRSRSARSLINTCHETLGDLLFNAVDHSAGLAVFRVAGNGSRQLLASGCGIDVRAGKLGVGECRRIRLARIPAVVAVSGDDQLDLYVDRSYAKYMRNWFEETVRGFLSNSGRQ